MERKTKNRGLVFALSSAFIFGLMPTFSLVLYSFHISAISLAFYRVFLSLPILWVLAARREAMRLDWQTNLRLLSLSAFFALTPILLFTSYKYTPSSTATALHFTYPASIVILNRTIYGIKSKPIEIISLILSTLGVFMISNFTGGGESKGVILALLSGLTYACYSIYLEKSGLSQMGLHKILFYMGFYSTCIYLIASLFLGPISFAYPGRIWVFLLAFSLLLSIFATGFYQLAIKLLGAKETSILSTLEPVVGVLMGIIVFGDGLEVRKALAIGLILTSTFLITKSQ